MTAAQETPDSRPRRGRPGSLAVLALCLILFPAFTVGYVAWSQAENNHKFCGVVDAALVPAPPRGDASANPSRAYEQNLHASFVGLKGRLGR